MATIYNSDLSNEIREGAKIQTSRDNIPSQLGQTVVPVMEVNPKLLRYVNFGGSSSTGTSAGTASASAADPNNDFFVTGITIGIVKDATCDNGNGVVSGTVTISGLAMSLVSIPVLTLTAQSLVVSQSFNPPVKIDRNTAVRGSAPTFTVGSCRFSISVAGFKQYNSLN